MASETPPCTPDRILEGLRQLSGDENRFLASDSRYAKHGADTGHNRHGRNPSICLSSVSEFTASEILDSMESRCAQDMAPTVALSTPSDSQGEPVPATPQHTLATLIQTSATLAERLVEFDESISDGSCSTLSPPLPRAMSDSSSVKRPSPPVAPPSALGIRRKIPRISGGPRLELPRLMLSPTNESQEVTDSIDKALNLADRNMEANKAALNQTRFATELTSSSTDIDDDMVSPGNMGMEQVDGKKVRFTEESSADTSMEICSSTSSEHTTHQEMIAI